MKTALAFNRLCAVFAVTAMLTGAAHGGTAVQVVVTGEVEFNQISDLPLGDANMGDPVELSFLVDSDIFLDSAVFSTRGYEIIKDSYLLTTGAVTIGMQEPFPDTEQPFFVLRDNDPAVDGFLTASHPDVGFPNGNPLDQTGRFDQFRMVYATTYPGDTLSSLDILGAVGTYDFTGLSVFSMRISDGAVESAMGMVFEQMTITAIPEPTADYNNSGTVEQADLDLVLLNWSAIWPPEVPGWINDQPNDGMIDQNDLDGVLLNWGNTSTSASVVPEPTGILLVLVGVGCVCLRSYGVSDRVSTTR